MTAAARVVESPADLVALADAVGERIIDASAAEGFLADPASVAIGGYRADHPAGYLIGYLVRRIDGPTMLIIYDVGVAEADRRHRVGTAMIAAALELASDAGAAKAWVITDTSNEAAMALYESTGATSSGKADRVMAWDLSREP